MVGETAAPKKRICFVVGPVGAPDSEERIHADWLLEEIIQPAFRRKEEYSDFDIVRSDKISQPGMIDAQIIQFLLDAELVVADLSFLNPNAFYEIGIRHMIQKPIIHMQLKEDKIPFDVSLYRAIKFGRTRPADLRQARTELMQQLDSLFVPGYRVENPITRARGQIRLEEHATPEQKLVIEQLRVLQQKVEIIEARGGQTVKPIVTARRAIPKSPVIEIFVHYREDKEDGKRILADIESRLGTTKLKWRVIHDGRSPIGVEIHEPLDAELQSELMGELAGIRGVHSVDDIPF